MTSKRGSTKSETRRIAPTDPAEAKADELPTSRVDRVAEMGRLGASLVGSIFRAGARGLVSGLGDRERAVAEAHRAGASVLVGSLGRLRGAAAKVGQFLAQRPGTLPDEYLEAMLSLTDRVPAMSASTAEAQIRNELGRAPKSLFASFERKPMAAGSFGQVHIATLHDGTKVAVKVQYPAVDEALASDLANLEMILPAVEKIANRDDLRALAAEIRDRLTEELDYRREAAAGTSFRSIFENAPIVVPKVHESLSTRRILTTDFIDGDPLEVFLARGPSLAERNRATLLLLRFHFTAVLEHGVLHVDPNPGNYLFLRDGSLGVVDFGCVKHFTPGFADKVRRLYAAAASGRDRAIDDALVDCGMFAPNLPAESRQPMRELARLWAEPCLVPDFDFSDRSYLDEITFLQHRLAREGVVTIPPEWVFYARQVLGVAYLLHRIGARHPSMFIENFALLFSIVPQASPPPRAKPARTTKAAAKSARR